MSQWPIVKAQLHCPSLEEVAGVLQHGLEIDFIEVSVSIVDCPDLTSKPFMLAAGGLCGKPRVIDIGGIAYLLPTPQMDKVYDLSQAPSWSELGSSQTLSIGAGAGPSAVVGKLVELVPNIFIDESGKVHNHTYISKVDDKTGHHVVEKFSNCCDSNHLTNLFVSEGRPGKVLKVIAKHKKSEKGNFITAMQSSLKQHYGTQPVGLGGVFVLTKGKARIHVMPNYAEYPLTSVSIINDWLKFYEMSAPLTAVGYLVSHDPGLNLRMEHFHCFSDHGDGGHFHYDVTPEQAEYEGYFNVPEYMFRVDQFDKDPLAS